MCRIKICGLSREQDIEAVNMALPDYAGLVFAESKRQVSREQAKLLRSLLDERILSVGVFVNADLHEVARLCQEEIIDLIQLHGEEDALYMTALRQKVANPIIKAVRVQSTKQILEVQKMPCDYLLLDNFDKGVYGGSGQSFDHSLIPKLTKPFFLAGGLNTSNIAAAAEARPYCLDISSGVETGGFKDKDKIAAIVSIVRGES